MGKTYRIGMQIIPLDPFWVEISFGLEQKAQKVGIELIPLDIGMEDQPGANYPYLLEQLLVQKIDALIIQALPLPLLNLIRTENIPIISLSTMLNCYKQECDHPAIVSPLGLYEISKLICDYLIERLHGKGTVLAIGGLRSVGEDGRTLIAGVYDKFAPYKDIQIIHIPANWNPDKAYPSIVEEMKRLRVKPDAIFGLSDPLALVGREVAAQLGLLKSTTVVVGSNGDPQALSAISEGLMAATVEISSSDFVDQAITLAIKAASKQTLPQHFNYKLRLVTPANVMEVAANKLFNMAKLPNQLIHVNRKREKQHITELETSLAINKQVGKILDPLELIRAVIELIRHNYNFDRVNFYPWGEVGKTVLLDNQGIMSEVIEKGELIFIPDLHHSLRFSPEPTFPNLRTRVVLPIRLGAIELGVLDLQRDKVTYYSQEQLMGLQSLADQLAIVMRNCELYSIALAARKEAEKADKLKTRLLANVSHELRTPLNIILGYTKYAMSSPNPYNIDFPDEALADFGRVYKSGEYLIRLINDLLDLSRAEIDELAISLQFIELKPFLEDIFHSIADVTSNKEAVKWNFISQPALPIIEVDPVRLRQVLLNLLANAQKFTQEGHITLGVEVEPPYIHFWVEDTGSGISAEEQETIFEPFMVGEKSERLSGGIGLGLTISRRLVALHHGFIRVESQLGKGSTFNVYLPLPNLNGQSIMTPEASRQDRLNVVYISSQLKLPPEIEYISHKNNIHLFQLHPRDVVDQLLKLAPSILAMDTSTMSEINRAILDYLRKTPDLARLPLMLYTTNSQSDNFIGATNILLKPLNDRTLQMFLETLLPFQDRGEIIIVDDEIQSIHLYQKMVESALPGVKIHRAESGQKAISILNEIVPALVIIDLIMPEMDGSDVVEWIRANPRTRNVPIIVISGKVLSAEHIERLEYAGVVFQSKDILKAEETASVFRQVLEGHIQVPIYNSILVKRTVTYLQKNYNQQLSLHKIAREVGVNRTTLLKSFHEEMGITPWEYLRRYRIKEAKQLLETTTLSITEVATEVGFDDPAYFSRGFRAQTGQSPKEYRHNSILGKISGGLR